VVPAPTEELPCVSIERYAARLAACLLLAGCTVGPNFEHPAAWWSPASWWQAAPAPAPPPSVPVAEPFDPHWWTILNDPLLADLEDRLAGANLDVRVADIRLAEARAQLGVAAAAELPTVNVNGSATRAQQSRKGTLALPAAAPATPNPATLSNGLGGTRGVSTGSLYKPYDLYQYGFDASWELDLWGRVSRVVESAGAQVLASEETQRDTLVTAGAELARDYVQLRGAQRKLEITRENLDTARQSLQLTQERAAGGVTTDLDVATAAAQVEATAALLPSQEQAEAELVNAISFLLGEPPRAAEVELAAPRAIPPVPPRVPVGLPSELARRRPDIRRAEAQLHAATADVGVAVGDFYPRFTLSVSGAEQGLQLRNLWDPAAATYAFGPAVTLPIFEGGQLTRTLELRQAQQQEAAITYQRTVLNALHEVDNALTAYNTEQRRRDRLEQEVIQDQRALELARERYEQGVADFLQVLIVQRDLLAAEQDLADSTTTVSTNLVQLYKALGGGWEADLPEAASARM
jgi:NodT family efflux transporter outer membrane factor (OMF) lipoprotein